MDIFIVVVGGGGVVAGVEEGVGVGRCVGDEEEGDLWFLVSCSATLTQPKTNAGEHVPWYDGMFQ